MSIKDHEPGTKVNPEHPGETGEPPASPIGPHDQPGLPGYGVGSPGPVANTLDGLVQQAGGVVRVACDTEYRDTHTLTAQFAARFGQDIVVQVYHSPAIPPPPDADTLEGLLPGGIMEPGQKLIIRPAKQLDPHLSPVRVLADLFGLTDVEAVHKVAGDFEATKAALAPPIILTFIAHFWTADFFRVFGERHFAGLIQRQSEGGMLVIQSRKMLAFKEVFKTCHRFLDPVLEYARHGGLLYPIRVRNFDTSLTYGKGKLDDHARTFLGLKKSSNISLAEKRDMLATFLGKPHQSYAYAILDSILTLGIERRMREEDARMYEKLGFENKDIPPLRPTLGSRVAEMITKSIAQAATGSVTLSQKGKPLANGKARKLSLSKVKALLSEGSAEFIAAGHVSVFGQQTGETHGGLLFSRSPTKFFHDAPGNLRDVDLSGCYASVIGSMNLYVGRPVVHEPGCGSMRLREAIAFLDEHAAGPDAWVVKVSGPIAATPNVLIPSTRGALTHANYQSRAAKKRAKSRRHGLVFDWLYEAGKHTGNATIYTDVIEAGFVAWPTWLMVQAMPPALREDYEDLEVETVLFYPKKMVAETGPEFDDQIAKFHHDQTSWNSSIDMDKLQLVIVKKLDADHVALRFDIGELAQTISGFRKQAKQEFGKGSGAELGWKQHANSMYGVAASRYLVTNNIVCANVITATARALAFAMQMSHNGIQVITDGCTYRRDQVPEVTFADCLKADPEYTIRRPEAGIAFHAAEVVPEDDVAYTTWYRQHVKEFFGVGGPDYDRLFGLHSLEHKKCGDPEQASFDGLCCDGSGNYLKLLREDGGWKVADFKARSFRREAKAVLEPWIVQTYAADRYDGPPPITESTALLTYKEANRVGRRALKTLEAPRSQAERETDPLLIYYPLGLESRRVLAYKVIKHSAFLFRTPQQQEKYLKAMQKYAESTGCGLEALSLRRGSGGRKKGSVVDVAEAIYRLIRDGEENLTKALNLTRSFAELENVRRTHFREILRRKAQADEELTRRIDARTMDAPATLTGLFVSLSDIRQFK